MDAAQVASIVNYIGYPSGTTTAEWVAKARQESSFREDVINVGAGKRHVGLWQIQETHKAVGALETAFMTQNQFVEWLKNPFNNFKVAKALYAGGGWKPWNASGGKPTPTAADEEAAEAGKLSDPTSAITSAYSDVFEAVTDPIFAAANWFGKPSNWTRILLVGGGLALVTVSAVLLVKPVVTDTIKEIRPV